MKVDPDLPPEIAALFGCAVLTGVGAAVNSAQIGSGESVVVYSLGGVGLAALIGARASGATPIVAIDPSADKRAIAAELGAIAVPPDEAVAAIPASSDDVGIETVGKAAVLRTAYGAARRGGRVVTVGLPNPSEKLDLPAVLLAAEGKTLIASYMGSPVPSWDIPR